MILILFDIDGTLISTDGAGMRAFRSAMYDACGFKFESDFIRPDGKTDPLILKEFLQSCEPRGLSFNSLRDAVFGKYLVYLEREMNRARETGMIRILPGVADLLETMRLQPDIAVGLVTGNLQDGARIKLKHAGLEHYFHFGGFGSDSEDRTLLTRIGIQRGIQHALPAQVDGSIVVGDTPLDIEHGRAAGAGVLSVASGRYSVDDLHACNPDLVLPDLTPVKTILSFIRNYGNNRGK